MSKDIFENLITDITAQVLQQVQQQINPVVVEAVNQRLESLIDGSYITQTVEAGIQRAIAQYKPDMSKVEQTIQDLTNNYSTLLTADLNVKINKLINERVQSLDVVSIAQSQITAKIDPANNTYPFPENSIEASALNATEIGRAHV